MSSSSRQPDALLLLGLELHDGAIQSLTAALMFLEAAAAGEGNLANQQRGTELVRSAVTELRALLSDIHEQPSSPITAHELVPKCCASLALALDLQVTCHVDKQPSPMQLSSAQAWHLTRVLGESLRNVARHSGQRAAQVHLASESDQLILTIADRGCGFVPAEVPSGHFGLRGIKLRAELLGGKLAVKSSPGGGTTLVVSLPAS